MNIKKAYILPLQSINKSSKAIAHADSTTGIARKTIQGSCLPFIISLVLFLLIKSIVSCCFAMEAVGLKATLNNIGIPEVIPPIAPP